MINILHISANQYPPIHQVNFTKKIWIELAKNANSYHIIARSKKNTFAKNIEGKLTQHLVPKLGNKERSFFFTSFFIFYLIPKYKITHLVAQSAFLGGFTAALASIIFRIPLMVEFHGEEYFMYFNSKSYFHKLISKIIKFTCNVAKKNRSLNSLMTLKLEKNNIKNIVEIVNRVDTTLFNPPKSIESFIINPNSKIKLVSVGRFVKEKNYINLIRVLIDSNLSFELILIGGGALRIEYEKEILKIKPNQQVILIDWIQQDKLVEKITQADFYIQSSVSEGMPRTIIEAMSLRMPIITTSVGSIAGVIKNDYNGVIINTDLSDLEKTINSLKFDYDKRIYISQNAMNEANTIYEWEKCFDKYRNEIYNM